MATTATTTTTQLGTLLIEGRFALNGRADARPALDRLDGAIRTGLGQITSDGHPPTVLRIEGAAPISRTDTDAPIVVEVEWDSRMTAASIERWTREAAQVVTAAIASL